MCMFYETPEQTRISKPITAYKAFTRGGKYPFQDDKPKENKWLRARAPKGEPVQNYGFHVFTNKQDAFKFRRNWNILYCVIREVKIRGNVYGIGTWDGYPSGMRVSSLYIPKRKKK